MACYRDFTSHPHLADYVNYLEMNFSFFETLKARVHQQDAKSDQNGPRRILPLQTSSPLGPVSTSKSPMNRALLSPDEGIEGFSN